MVALALAALGIYGVRANLVAQQTREISVRAALGARYSSVLWLVLRPALTLTATGVAIGLAGATALAWVMSGLLYEVLPHGALAFVGALIGLALLALMASLVQALRATRVDSIVALRTE